MKNFISSENVQVYPTAFREGYNPTASLNTEYNITTLITRLTDKDSFVIHANKSNNKIKDIWFSLLGYWFYADITELYDEDYPYSYYNQNEEKYDYTLYANIEIVNGSYEGDTFTVPSLANYTRDTVTILDEDDDFKGVKFTQSPDTESGKTIYSLKIIDKDGNIPEESFIKIGTHAIANTKYENNIPSIENEASLNRLLKVNVNNIESNGLLIENGNDVLEQTTKTKKDINVPVNINGNTSITGKTTASGNVDITGNMVISGDMNINNQETGFKVSGGNTNLKDLNLQANVSVGESDYSGDIKIKSKKNLTVVGESSEAQTLTFTGSTAFQSGNYSSVATVGSESITVGSNAINVVTRDTQQTISGKKTFTGDVVLNSRETGFKILGGSTNSKTLDAQVDLSLGASDYTGNINIKSKGNLSVIGNTTSEYTVTFTQVPPPPDGEYFSDWVTFQGGDYASVTTAGSETITIGNNTFNIVTRDTAQTISGKKSFTNDLSVGSSFSVNASTGDVTANTYTANSDRRIKENIKPYIAKGNILDLSVYEYNYIDDSSRVKRVGCLAQDLLDICPEIVHENSNGYYSIEESKIVYLLLEEVKKLRQEVDALKSK